MLLLCLLVPLCAPAAPAEAPMPLRYVRASGDTFVLESEVTETRAPDGLRYTSRTERPGEKMTLTLLFDGKGRLRKAEALQETAKGKQAVTVVFAGKEAVLKRPGVERRLAATPDAIVTTAPDWSDIFQAVRRYDRSKGDRQTFAGLWIHPVKEARLLTFVVEPLKEEAIAVGGRKLLLTRYRVTLRSGAYLVWADRAGRVYRLMPPGKPAAAVVLEGHEKATSGLR
jgi:hypothetical protein